MKRGVKERAWTAREESLLRDERLTNEVLSIRLGISVRSVQRRRQELKGIADRDLPGTGTAQP